MSSIIFTTAYKDICRELWNHYGRTNERYFAAFRNLAEHVQYKLVVYLENDIKDEVLKKGPFSDNIIFVDMRTVNTFYDIFLELDKKIISSEQYKRLIPHERSVNPEHVFSEYNMINHSKVNFLQNTRTLFPEYDYYAWIDFGSINENVTNIPKTMNFDMLSPKIIYHCLQNPHYPRRDEINMLQTFDIYFTGSSFIVHRDLVSDFETLYKQKIVEWQSKSITDDDQNLVLQIYYDHPELFQLVINPEWFTLYKMVSS